MKSGLETLMDDIRRFTKTRPPYNEAFTARAIYLLNHAVHVMDGLNIIIKKNQVEIGELQRKIAQQPKEIPASKPKQVKAAADQNQIAKDYLDGMTVKEIAEKHGITAGRVSQLTLKLRLRDYGTTIPSATRLSGSRDPIYTRYAPDGDEPDRSTAPDRGGENSDSSSDHSLGAR